MVQGHTVWTSRPVCSVELVALMVPGSCHTPSEEPRKGLWSCWAARASSARPSRVDSWHHGSSRVHAAGVTTPCHSPGARAAGSLSLWPRAMEATKLLLLFVRLHCSVHSSPPAWPGPQDCARQGTVAPGWVFNLTLLRLSPVISKVKAEIGHSTTMPLAALGARCQGYEELNRSGSHHPGQTDQSLAGAFFGHSAGRSSAGAAQMGSGLDMGLMLHVVGCSWSPLPCMGRT